MQKISDDLNKMKCLFSCGMVIKEREAKLLQVINCGRRFRSGCPLRIHRLTTTLHVKPITMGPPRGSSKGKCMVNGRRGALFCGPTEIVRFFLFSLPLSLIVSGFVAGSGKSVLWWVTFDREFVGVAYIGDQLFDHKGHRIHTCDWTSFSRILLL